MSKSKYEKDFKVEVLEKGIVKQLTKCKRDWYKDGVAIPVTTQRGNETWTYYFNDFYKYIDEMKYHDEGIDCALRILRSKKKKARKVKEKISNIVMNHNAIFLTLTFTDEVLQKTTEDTRRRYVARYLKECSSEYVGNIDFSPDINREHYHAVVCNRVDLEKWSYGFAFARQIRAHDRDLCRISKYITKLTAHALKVDATRLIYSRASSNM